MDMNAISGRDKARDRGPAAGSPKSSTADEWNKTVTCRGQVRVVRLKPEPGLTNNGARRHQPVLILNHIQDLRLDRTSLVTGPGFTFKLWTRVLVRQAAG